MKKLTQLMDVFTLGIGRVIASGYAMRECIPFLQTGYMDALDWIATHGIQSKYVTHINWESYDPNNEIVKKIDCPNCADQASIAAPGETVLCKTHADEKHFSDMKEFFNDEVQRIWFKSHTPFCSACGTDKHVVYVGVINTENSGPLVWSFCGDCRDELTLKRNAARAALERIGA